MAVPRPAKERQAWPHRAVAGKVVTENVTHRRYVSKVGLTGPAAGVCSITMRGTLMFLGQMASHWRTTGAIAPSGPSLARAMAKMVGDIRPGQVVLELGPGTGSFTKELVRRFPHNRIVAVEFNSVFVRSLRAALPGVTVVEGCATQLPKHLNDLGIAVGDVAAVVSGLPLLSLPRHISTGILNAVAEVLPMGRRYVQFTYSKRAWRKFDPPGFRSHPSKRVWLNVPPAVVLPFTRAG